jgi:hypothetical protein
VDSARPTNTTVVLQIKIDLFGGRQMAQDWAIDEYSDWNQQKISCANFYLQKWDEIIFSTQPVIYEAAVNAVIDAYNLVGISSPKVYFMSSTSFVQSLVLKSINWDSNLLLKRKLENMVSKSIGEHHLKNKFYLDLPLALKNPGVSDREEKFKKICSTIYEEYIYDLDSYKVLESEALSTNLWRYDFYINCVDNTCNLNIWNALKSLCEECPYLLTYENCCVIIERPSELYLDRELLPHADGKAAIKFADGYEIYCNHGIIIPAKYGQICSTNWQAEWLLSEEDSPTATEESILALQYNIGFKRFATELPEIKHRYWIKKEGLRSPTLIDWAFDYIIPNWLEFHYYEYYNNTYYNSSDRHKNTEGMIKLIPYTMTEELSIFYSIYAHTYSFLAPGLHFYLLEEEIKKSLPGLDSCPVQIFYGDRHEIYYVICDHEERLISPVYCQFLGKEPIVYAECLSSLIATIAQCYQEGAYYIAINEQTGERSIEQDLDKIEPIFEKFNPDQIDTWRKIWKG